MFSINWNIRIIYFFTVFKGHIADELVKNLNNYGPYDIEFKSSEICAGPKSRNVTRYTLEMNKDGKDFIANGTMTFLSHSHIDEIKITVFVLKEKQKTMLFNYKINNPCQHYAFASMIEMFFDASKCTIKKGDYYMTLNLSDVARKFYGKSFFYGDFFIKANVLSRQGNILCWILNSVFTKKT